MPFRLQIFDQINCNKVVSDESHQTVVDRSTLNTVFYLTDEKILSGKTSKPFHLLNKKPVDNILMKMDLAKNLRIVAAFGPASRGLSTGRHVT